MPRMKNRWEHPPGGFQAIQPEMGQATPFTGSFNAVAEQLLALRQANPFLCERHGLSTDMASIEAEIDFYNATRCIAGGWTQFVILDDPASASAGYTAPPAQKKIRAAAGAAKNIAAGISLLLDWVGPSAKAVPNELAEKRASVCATCPLNGQGGLLEYFTSAAAEKIRTQLAIRADLQLKTSLDPQLGTCTACSCWLPLKCHVPIEFILAHTSDEVKSKLDPRCWVLAESKQP